MPIFNVTNVGILTKMWADEMAEEDGNCEPDPKLESFYVLAALEFGDPDGYRWLESNAVKFYEFWKKFRAPGAPNYSGPKVILQYIFWYEHARPRQES